VIVLGYAGRASDLWWEKNGAALARCSNLTVLDLPARTADELAALYARSMSLQALVQDGELQLMGDAGTVEHDHRDEGAGVVEAAGVGADAADGGGYLVVVLEIDGAH
jgi:uncharacterized protein YaeQ